MTPRMNSWLLLAALGLLAVAAGVALPSLLASSGEQSASSAPMSATLSDWPETPDLGRLGIRLAVGTTVVLALCAVTLWAGQRWTPGGNSPGAVCQLRVLASLPVGGHCVVHLVEAAGCHVLVGVDRGGVKELITLPEPVEEAGSTQGESGHAGPGANG